MGFWIGQIGLAVSFVILAAILLWVFIKSKVNPWIKFILIPVVIWYGFVIYYTPQKFGGFPKFERPPNNSIIISWHVVEPSPENKTGFIYLWTISDEKETYDLLEQFFPENVFILDPKNIPVAYKIKYERKVHERIFKMTRKLREQPGAVMRFNFRNGEMNFDLFEPGRTTKDPPEGN